MKNFAFCVLHSALALCASADITFGSKWYEAVSDKQGTTFVGWKQLWMGADIAIPVEVTDASGESVVLSSDDVTIKPGTYIDYGKPRVMSEMNMWMTYGQSIQDVFNAGSRIDLEKDGGVWVYNNWDWEDISGVTYELEKGIWPFFGEKGRDYLYVNDWLEAHSSRQWILIPTGKRPQKGTHTFTVRVESGGKTASFAVSFTMNPDQKAKAATVRFNANGGKVSECGRVVNLNAEIGTLPKPTRKNYTFKGWYTAKTKGSRVVASTKVTKAMTLYARWTGKKYWVRECDHGNGNGYARLYGLGKYAAGSKVTIKATPRNKNWVFGCWDWGFESEGDISWKSLVENIQNTTLTFTMPPCDVQLMGYCLKKSEDYAPKFTLGFEGSAFVSEKDDEFGIRIESQSYPKINVNKSIPAGMKLVKDLESWSGYECCYRLKVSDWSKLPKGTIKTVKLTATNRSGKKTTKSFKVIMPSKTQAIDKGVLELNIFEPYELNAGVKVSWKDLDISVCDGWKIKSVTGIPGLKWDAAKQRMTGVPSKAGTYVATFKVAKGSTTYVATATFVVNPLPKALVGTFYGFTASDYDMDETGDYPDSSLPYYMSIRNPRLGLLSENVKVSVSSAGKISAKVGDVSFSGIGLEHLSNSVYKVNLKESQKITSGMFKDCVQSWSCEFEIDGSAAWNQIQLKGECWYLGHPCASSMGGPQYMVARKNAAATDKTAKDIAVRYAKLGKQSFIVSKARSGSDYAYVLDCPECVDGGDKAKKTVFLKVEKDGKATLSGKIGGVAVSGTAYLTYEHSDGDLRVFARFFSGGFVIEIEGEAEYIYNDGAMYGRAWK